MMEARNRWTEVDTYTRLHIGLTALELGNSTASLARIGCSPLVLLRSFCFMWVGGWVFIWLRFHLFALTSSFGLLFVLMMIYHGT